MENHKYVMKKYPSNNFLICCISLVLALCSYGMALGYVIYLGAGEGFPHSENSSKYHLFGIAVFLAIVTVVGIGFNVFSFVRLNGRLKLVPVLSVVVMVLPLLFFILEARHWFY